MTTIYRLNANDLSPNIINSIREAFKGKTIDIIVMETTDETEYLLSNPANVNSIFQSISELEQGQGTLFTVEELQAKYGS